MRISYQGAQILCVLSLKALALLLFCLIQKFYVFLYFSDQSAIGHLLDFGFGKPVAYIRRYTKKSLCVVWAYHCLVVPFKNFIAWFLSQDFNRSFYSEFVVSVRCHAVAQAVFWYFYADKLPYPSVGRVRIGENRPLFWHICFKPTPSRFGEIWYIAPVAHFCGLFRNFYWACFYINILRPQCALFCFACNFLRTDGRQRMPLAQMRRRTIQAAPERALSSAQQSVSQGFCGGAYCEGLQPSKEDSRSKSFCASNRRKTRL